MAATYLTLSLSDIAAQLHLPSPRHAEELLLRMIDGGELAASISQKDGMVLFEDSGQTSSVRGGPAGGVSGKVKLGCQRGVTALVND